MHSQPDDHTADDEFLGVVLPELRADGNSGDAQALVADYVRKHAEPLRWD